MHTFEGPISQKRRGQKPGGAIFRSAGKRQAQKLADAAPWLNGPEESILTRLLCAWLANVGQPACGHDAS
jgi:hypothetical protein